MYIYIGPPGNWFGPFQLVDYLKYLGVSENIRHKIAEKLPEKPFSWFDEKFKKQKVKIRVDKHDTWNMDKTLALIVVPMLKQLKETSHGSPFVDDEDVPENLRSTNAKPKENDWDVDEFHFQRWNCVLDEMIFAFEAITTDSWEDQFYTGEIDLQWKVVNLEEKDKEKQLWESVNGPNHTFRVDNAGMEEYNKRINNGIRLFGKYYRNLWN